MKNIDAELRKLGKSADAIARALRRKGIKGAHAWESCPIARFTTRKLGYMHAQVTAYRITVWTNNHDSTCDRTEIITPLHIAAFIKRFDAGKYPALESKR
jgi:hypothetical protein